MGWLWAIIIGGVVGWLYSYAVRPEERNYWADIVAGAGGSLLGVWFFSNLLGLGSPLTSNLATFTFLSTIWSILGAIIVTAIVQAALVAPMEKRAPSYYEEVRERRKKREEEDKNKK